MKPPSKDPTRVNAIVPIKAPSRSKRRLARILSDGERGTLTLMMAGRVLSALRMVPQIKSVTVVSAEKDRVREMAQKYDATFLLERRRGLNWAVRLAIEENGMRNGTGTLIIHADLPLVSSHEIEELLKKSMGYQVALVPSRDGIGTNAVLLRPPDVIPPCFGGKSYARFLKIIGRRRLRCRVVKLTSIGFDLDKPKDLYDLINRRIDNETAQYLLRKRLVEPSRPS